MEFSRQEHWRELPFPLPGDPPEPGIEPASHASPALAGDRASWEALLTYINLFIPPIGCSVFTRGLYHPSWLKHQKEQ